MLLNSYHHATSLTGKYNFTQFVSYTEITSFLNTIICSLSYFKHMKKSQMI